MNEQQMIAMAKLLCKQRGWEFTHISTEEFDEGCCHVYHIKPTDISAVVKEFFDFNNLNICFEILEWWKRKDEHRSVFCEMLKDAWHVSVTNRRELRQWSATDLDLPTAIAQALLTLGE